MRILALRIALLAVLLSSGSCYSIAVICRTQRVRTDGATFAMRIRVDAPGPGLSDPPCPVYDAFVVLLLSPIELVTDLLLAVQAPFDRDLDVRWGPVGGVAAVVLPGLTLIPFLMDAGERDLVLDRRTFDAFLARMKDGGGVEAYLEFAGDARWNRPDAIHSVELIDDDPAQGARQGAGTGEPQEARQRG